jgi:hypothetical protein
MTKLNVTLSDEASRKLAERARQNGFAGVEDFARAILETEATLNDVDDDAELEELLLQRLDSGPSVELTSEFFEKIKSEVDARRLRAATGAK